MWNVSYYGYDIHSQISTHSHLSSDHLTHTYHYHTPLMIPNGHISPSLHQTHQSNLSYHIPEEQFVEIIHSNRRGPHQYKCLSCGIKFHGGARKIRIHFTGQQETDKPLKVPICTSPDEEAVKVCTARRETALEIHEQRISKRQQKAVAKGEDEAVPAASNEEHPVMEESKKEGTGGIPEEQFVEVVRHNPRGPSQYKCISCGVKFRGGARKIRIHFTGQQETDRPLKVPICTSPDEEAVKVCTVRRETALEIHEQRISKRQQKAVAKGEDEAVPAASNEEHPVMEESKKEGTGGIPEEQFVEVVRHNPRGPSQYKCISCGVKFRGGARKIRIHFTGQQETDRPLKVPICTSPDEEAVKVCTARRETALEIHEQRISKRQQKAVAKGEDEAVPAASNEEHPVMEESKKEGTGGIPEEQFVEVVRHNPRGPSQYKCISCGVKFRGGARKIRIHFTGQQETDRPLKVPICTSPDEEAVKVCTARRETALEIHEQRISKRQQKAVAKGEDEAVPAASNEEHPVMEESKKEGTGGIPEEQFVEVVRHNPRGPSQYKCISCGVKFRGGARKIRIHFTGQQETDRPLKVPICTSPDEEAVKVCTVRRETALEIHEQRISKRQQKAVAKGEDEAVPAASNEEHPVMEESKKEGTGGIPEEQFVEVVRHNPRGPSQYKCISCGVKFRGGARKIRIHFTGQQETDRPLKVPICTSPDEEAVKVCTVRRETALEIHEQRISKRQQKAVAKGEDEAISEKNLQSDRCRNVRVAAAQMSISKDSQCNIDSAERLVREAAKKGSNIVLLPELFQFSYFFQVEDPTNFSLSSAYSPNSNPLLLRFSSLAKELGVVIPLSFFEKKKKSYFNSVAVIDADGKVLGCYRKSHIIKSPGYSEKFYASPGDTGFRVFRTKFGSLGVGICQDQWFPEAARAMALKGAEILLFPTSIGAGSLEHHHDSVGRWQRTVTGHAACNLIPVVVSNRIGTEVHKESTVSFYGSSFITDGTGEIVQQASDSSSAIIFADLDLEYYRVQRRAFGLVQERRPELYSSLHS